MVIRTRKASATVPPDDDRTTTREEDLPFRPGELVMCRYSSYPYWPATIRANHAVAYRGRFWAFKRTRAGETVLVFWCVFCNDSSGGWVRHDRIVAYHPAIVDAARVAPGIEWHAEQRDALKAAAYAYNALLRGGFVSPLLPTDYGPICPEPDEPDALVASDTEAATDPARAAAQPVLRARKRAKTGARTGANPATSNGGDPSVDGNESNVAVMQPPDATPGALAPVNAVREVTSVRSGDERDTLTRRIAQLERTNGALLHRLDALLPSLGRTPPPGTKAAREAANCSSNEQPGDVVVTSPPGTAAPRGMAAWPSHAGSDGFSATMGELEAALQKLKVSAVKKATAHGSMDALTKRMRAEFARARAVIDAEEKVFAAVESRILDLLLDVMKMDVRATTASGREKADMLIRAVGTTCAGMPRIAGVCTLIGELWKNKAPSRADGHGSTATAEATDGSPPREDAVVNQGMDGDEDDEADADGYAVVKQEALLNWAAGEQ